MAKTFANSGDPDQTPRSAASDLGLHCFPILLLGSQDFNELSDLAEIFHNNNKRRVPTRERRHYNIYEQQNFRQACTSARTYAVRSRKPLTKGKPQSAN